MLTLKTPQPPFNQGIQGQVIQVSGDYMPHLSSQRADLSNDQPSNRVQTKVWIFAGQILGTGSPQWSVASAIHHPNFVRSVESDRQGHYSVSLSPGEYTVFAQYDATLYLNAFQGNGSFKTVIVNEGEIVDLDLVNISNAIF